MGEGQPGCGRDDAEGVLMRIDPTLVIARLMVITAILLMTSVVWAPVVIEWIKEMM